MTQLRSRVTEDDHLQGRRDAPVVLVEYGDYECPFCGKAYWEAKRLQEALGDQLCFVFRNFPLTQVHPHALQAAEAAEAAGAQGKFWEMHDMLFENQEALEMPSILSYAEALGLDLQQFTQDLEEHRFQERIQRDFMSGVRSGVNGTPTFFINGYRHNGAYTAEALLDAISGGTAAYGP
jgi:protein-disulfide isomerase